MVEGVLGFGSFQLVPLAAWEAFGVGGVHVEVGSFEAVVLLCEDNQPGLVLPRFVTLLIDCPFLHGGLFHFKLAQMPSASALPTHPLLFLVQSEAAL